MDTKLSLLRSFAHLMEIAKARSTVAAETVVECNRLRDFHVDCIFNIFGYAQTT